jgi:predicted Zn-dependent protease
MAVNTAPQGPRSFSSYWLIWLGIAATFAGLAASGAFRGLFSWEEPELRAALTAVEQDQFFGNAEPLLRRVYDRHPDNVRIVRALGLGYLEAHRFDEAEEFLNRWCALRPREAEPFRRRIELWMPQLKTSRAVADVQTVLQIQPDDLRGRQILAQLLFLDARVDEAELEAAKCLQEDPGNKEILHLIASIYQRQGRPAEATSLVDRWLRTMPNSAPALSVRADLYLEAGQVEQAIQLLTSAAGNPALDRSFGRFPLASPWLNATWKLSEVQERPFELDEPNTASPARASAGADSMLDSCFILYQLGQALTRAGRDQEAKSVLAELRWRRALDVWSKTRQRDVNAALQGRVVDAYVAAGKLEDAVLFLTDILHRQPNASDTRQLLADCYDKQGQTERAAEQRRLSGRGP